MRPAAPVTTAEKFAGAYAARSGVTVEWLRERGKVVKRCLCEQDICEGWQMISQEHVDEEERFWREGYGPRPDWIEPG